MDRRIAQLRQEKDSALQKAVSTVEAQTSEIEDHLTQVRDEYGRVVQLSGQAGYVLDNIDREFKAKTKLTGKDMRWAVCPTISLHPAMSSICQTRSSWWHR